MMTTDEKLVQEGGRLKFLCEKRQLGAESQGGIVLDYLRFTIKRHNIPKTGFITGNTSDQDLARWFAHLFSQMLGFFVGVDRAGRDYYEYTTTINNEWGHEVASVSAGGESQRGSICFSIKGEGCTHARQGWETRVHDYFAEFLPTITRIDLAKDFFDGEVSIAEIVGMYQNHGFSYRRRMPKHTCHGSWMDVGNVKAHARTFQVGKRESGKLFRGYEKGHQFAMMESRWLRCEVELRNINRVIPWDSIISPAEYFAGAYSATHLISQREIATPIKTATMVGDASAQRCIDWLKRVVSPTLLQIMKVMPEFDWLEGLAVDQAHRPVPRSLRGLSARAIQHGIQAALLPFTNPCEPAAAGP
ncbi:replication initiation protein [Verminephrobacter aporrectodeae subsp. tuberculatae]|uniref:replication initiation factor domain-containing protein n=1 Tax=Verminephrobacter aporrectodeae TaxID=1110389 RepID=UPI002237F210|nr:replication initiation factor domain-containing protein [Verminephrobacter aporrectodeae]MCW5222832.1 replication initiation protein [Verminephrobacter aporrectodeae subsp. tuberculatae]MCW5288296.1 replication initiation protein [Verminephrobacter aporrectodeae subsp. tuberculatae]